MKKNIYLFTIILLAIIFSSCKSNYHYAEVRSGETSFKSYSAPLISDITVDERVSKTQTFDFRKRKDFIDAGSELGADVMVFGFGKKISKIPVNDNADLSRLTIANLLIEKKGDILLEPIVTALLNERNLTITITVQGLIGRYDNYRPILASDSVLLIDNESIKFLSTDDGDLIFDGDEKREMRLDKFPRNFITRKHNQKSEYIFFDEENSFIDFHDNEFKKLKEQIKEKK